MKAPTVLVSLLALAGTTTAAESADAAVSDLEIPNDLKEAICGRDWYEAIELSSALITSSNITPDNRQALLELRRSFYTHVKGEGKSDEIADCKGIQVRSQARLYQGPTPRFSNSRISDTSGRYCYQSDYIQASGQQCNDTIAETVVERPLQNRRSILDSLWTVGARVEGNSVRGTVLNNGLAAVKNVTLTIRSQQDDQSEAIKTVSIDTVNAWSETDFVATFNHEPGNWLIESIEAN